MKYITLKNERDRRLTAAVRDRMSRERLDRANSRLLGEILAQPVERGFFVSVDHVLVMDRKRREGKLPEMGKDHQQLWGEIFSTFDSYLNSQPRASRTRAAIHVVSRGRASRYFITEKNAVSILRKNKIRYEE